MNEFFIALFIVIICSGNFLWGYLWAKRECRSEIEALKKNPVNVKYVHSNLVPVTVQRVMSVNEYTDGIVSLDRIIVPLMKRDLGEALWNYTTVETSECADNSVVYRASILVRPNSEGVKP